MYIHLICFFLCTGILQICAFPAPQSSTEDLDINSTQDPIEDLIEDDLPVAQKSDEEVVTEMSTDESVGQDSTEPISNTNKVSNSSYPTVEAQEASNDNHEGSENEAPKISLSEDETVNSEADKELNETKTVKPDSVDSKNDLGDIGFTVTSDIYVLGRRMRVKEKDMGDEKILCQLLIGKNEEIVDKKCVTVTTPHFIYDDEKIIDDLNGPGTDQYKCQVILDTFSERIIQQLCVTYDGWIFDPVNVSNWK